ncbi:hypothetical protein MSAN_00345700 [Mycena sanguinolenta]|uniref:Uncharacterized protein n=1 Tax=Mycena sanguinolenta TaxID=230812 RepID=A0A8H6ZCY4_9AGAR|nr:hypothetical protein MSAN_00345700 [Mycena sanguinolenta]
MFYRRLFALAASVLSFLSSVETPSPGVVLISSKSISSYPASIWVDDLDTLANRSPANVAREFRLVEELAVFIEPPGPSTTSAPHDNRPAPTRTSKFDIIGFSIDLDDVERLHFAYTVTTFLARQFGRKTRFAWWRLLVDVLKGALVLGGMVVRLGLGLGESTECIEVTAVFNVPTSMDWLRRLATVSSRRVRRVARCILNLVRATDLSLLITCFELPSASPLAVSDFTDLDKVVFTYFATVHITRRLCATTGLPWWRAVRDASIAAWGLGGAVVSFGYRLGGTNDESLAALYSIHCGVVSSGRRARILARKRYRAVQSRVPRIQSTDVLFLVTFFSLPFEVPLGHLVHALVLNGTVLSILAKYLPFTHPFLEFFSPPPALKIRRATKRYQRGRRVKIR